MDERNGCEVIVIEMCKWIVSWLYTRIYRWIYLAPRIHRAEFPVPAREWCLLLAGVKGARRWKGQDLVM